MYFVNSHREVRNVARLLHEALNRFVRHGYNMSLNRNSVSAKTEHIYHSHFKYIFRELTYSCSCAL